MVFIVLAPRRLAVHRTVDGAAVCPGAIQGPRGGGADASHALHQPTLSATGGLGPYLDGPPWWAGKLGTRARLVVTATSVPARLDGCPL
jgi:hypothetical protein